MSDFEVESDSGENTDSEPDTALPPPAKRRLTPPSGTALTAGRAAAARGEHRGAADTAVRRQDVGDQVWIGAPAPESGPEEMGKDGSVWLSVPLGTGRGRRPSQNILREIAGPTAFARHGIHDLESAFLCLMDPLLLQHIRDCTVAEARRSGIQWDLSIPELKAFIALLYVRGSFNKNLEMESLWSDEWGLPFSRSTMPRRRYRQIMRFLRFDRREERQARLASDKFALITDVWRDFVTNSIRCYRPGENVTVDEQLYPTKARCRFTQYMANKPDKFGIKFWMAADVDSKYFLNGIPYLGRDAARPAGQRLGERVVLNLMEPFMDKGRNVTTDNFFTSLSLAKCLLARNTSLVGTMNAARRELPPSAKQRAELHSTKVLKHERATLTLYQAKRKKSVSILSTLHQTVLTGTEGKRKPETITFYNTTKVGVDSLDQMARLYSTKGATRRWPVAVFCNILDLAAINAWVLYRQCTGANIARRAFILELAKELRREHMLAKAAPPATVQRPLLPLPYVPHPQVPERRRQCQINAHCKQNKTTVVCSGCKRPVCGKCVVQLEPRCLKCV
uniref:PiggyBac transposable element-derived protein domain-containing protein n=1 Tax=Knipowitschia caucasica TaxID=637954 RepID=A0AAV2MH86_KNICA